jgi:hypothetical protein
VPSKETLRPSSADNLVEVAYFPKGPCRIQPTARTTAAGIEMRQLGEAVSSHDGVRLVEQGRGDSFVAAFARASDAVACALALQLSLAEGPIALRLGLRTGEVILADPANYLGPAVNRTTQAELALRRHLDLYTHQAMDAHTRSRLWHRQPRSRQAELCKARCAWRLQ